jgi:hypothetical protein
MILSNSHKIVGFDREHTFPVLPLLLSLYSSHTRQETEVEEDEQCTDTKIGDERSGCHTACMLAI